jgi:Family of unknown function (DUF5340)
LLDGSIYLGRLEFLSILLESLSSKVPHILVDYSYMESIPLPSHIHYELLLQLLERQSLFAANHHPQQREQIQQLIATLRKAMAQQKQLEEECDRLKVPFEYRWSLNTLEMPIQIESLARESNGLTEAKILESR